MMASSTSWKPDLVVAVDFGMTSTGVAYSTSPDWPYPTALQKWPGTVGSELQNKVLTALSYRSNTDQVEKWGWEVDVNDDSLDNVELFKVYLDPNFRDFDEYRMTVTEALGYFSDYMRCLYGLIQRHFLKTTPYFQEMKVEFVFSFPTTWNDHGMFHEILSRIRMAGFGDNSFNRQVKLSLNEAEAAAVYALRNNFRRGDVLLILDAGGGTTDLSILKVLNIGVGGRELKPLAAVGGVPVGSAGIDLRVQRIIEEKLKQLPEHGIQLEEANLRKISAQMLREGRFYSFKCGFGDEAIDVPFLPLSIPKLTPGISIPEVGIRDSKLYLTREELKSVFDWQIDKIFRLIDTQLSDLSKTCPYERVSHLVISGGFGNSPYLQRRLQETYSRPGSSQHSNAHGMGIIVADNAQLAVVQGLVMDRTQEISRGIPVYTQRCARLSYGIACRMKYDAARHQGAEVEKDPYDKQLYAENMIDWFIYKGEPVSTELGVKKAFRIKFNVGQSRYSWRTRIIASSLEPSQLPQSLRQDGARQICTVEAEIDRDTSMKTKNNKWWRRGPEYMAASVSVRVVVGAADLKFEILTPTGFALSKAHDEILVDWDVPPGGAAELATQNSLKKQGNNTFNTYDIERM